MPLKILNNPQNSAKKQAQAVPHLICPKRSKIFRDSKRKLLQTPSPPIMMKDIKLLRYFRYMSCSWKMFRFILNLDQSNLKFSKFVHRRLQPARVLGCCEKLQWVHLIISLWFHNLKVSTNEYSLYTPVFFIDQHPLPPQYASKKYSKISQMCAKKLSQCP